MGFVGTAGTASGPSGLAGLFFFLHAIARRNNNARKGIRVLLGFFI
jgi:hypothetical protein